MVKDSAISEEGSRCLRRMQPLTALVVRRGLLMSNRRVNRVEVAVSSDPDRPGEKTLSIRDSADSIVELSVAEVRFLLMWLAAGSDLGTVPGVDSAISSAELRRMAEPEPSRAEFDPWAAMDVHDWDTYRRLFE